MINKSNQTLKTGKRRQTRETKWNAPLSSGTDNSSSQRGRIDLKNEDNDNS